MKYIFLDIDGVLNSSNSKNLIDGVIDENKYSMLKNIIDQTNARVIIISSRRLYLEDRNQLLNIFDDIYDKVSFLSFKLLNKYRKDEINIFLNNNTVRSFVILDDIDDNYTKDENINKHFIHIDSVTGLNEKDVKKAIEILNN